MSDNRFVAVRWLVPGVGPVVSVYDRQSPGDMDAWAKNDDLKYISQVLGSASDPASLPKPTGWDD